MKKGRKLDKKEMQQTQGGGSVNYYVVGAKFKVALAQDVYGDVERAEDRWARRQAVQDVADQVRR